MPMNRVVALGIVGWIAFAALGGCQGADPFDRPADGSVTGGGGRIVTGNGGRVVTGNGGSGAGGRASGGIGAGGSSMGGRGAGGNATGGRGMGGTGAGGVGAGGSNVGGRGMGGTGAGGRIVDAGANCISAIQMASYSAGTASCAACLDHSTSIGPQCMMMIDCLGVSYPCTGNCYTMCFNKVGGSNPLVDCMTSFNISSSGCGP